MSFRKKIDFVQLEREELVEYRPVLIYVTALACSKDSSCKTSSYRHYTPCTSSAEGVFRKDANPYNLCLIEASPDLQLLKEQVDSAFEHYGKAAHKVVILNARGTPEGVLLEGKDEKKAAVVLSGQTFAELVTPHTDGHNLHVFVFASHGHIFSTDFYSYVRQGSATIKELVAVSYFTTKDRPTSWDMVSTVGNGNVEVTRESREFIKTAIRPNNPYKTFEDKIKP